jgi:glycosyltransferase involved in cell wall biosynthesis
MREGMKISIAMATYNGAKYIKEQLDSFVAQTRRPDELVVYDDCSSDETFEILKDFAAQAPFNVCLRQTLENLGYAKNFCKALSLCTGDLIFLSDQDDVWFTTKIETMAGIAENDSINQVFMNDAEITYEDLRPTGLTKFGQIKTAGLLEQAFVMGCCAVIKAPYLKDILPVPDSCCAHDVWIVKIAEGLRRKRIVEKTLQYYRRHGENASLFIVNHTKKVNLPRWLWFQIVSRVNKNGMDKLEQSFSRINLMTCKLNDFLVGEPKEYVTIDIVNEYLDELASEKEAIYMRLKVLGTPRIKRFPLISKMLACGQYKYFYGVKSAFGDLLFD